jgi:hypothetical protein
VFKAIGVIFALFVVLFVAIIIEEVFLGGKRRRKAEKLVKVGTDADNSGD